MEKSNPSLNTESTIYNTNNSKVQIISEVTCEDNIAFTRFLHVSSGINNILTIQCMDIHAKTMINIDT